METNRKRTRDETDDKNRPFKGKKREITFDYLSDVEFSESYEFIEGFRVFDFPWLKKEGVMFDADEYLKPEDHTFASCSYLESEIIDDAFCPTLSLDHQCYYDVRDPLASPTSYAQNLHGNEVIEDGNFDQGNDLDPVNYSIWSYVIDKPLGVGLMKV